MNYYLKLLIEATRPALYFLLDNPGEREKVTAILDRVHNDAIDLAIMAIARHYTMGDSALESLKNLKR